jgi:uncharacterized protein YndB with AHSA1/START domain
MAVSAVVETTIPRTAADVFEALTDLAGFPEWLVSSGIVAVEAIGDGALEEGTKLRIDQRVAGRSTTLNGRVTAFEPGRRFGLQAKDHEGIGLSLDAALAADGPLTTLRWSLKLSLPLKWRFFEAMVAPQVQEAAVADLERLRVRLSAVAG